MSKIKKVKKISKKELDARAASKLEGKALNALSRFNFGVAFGLWQRAQEVRAGKASIKKVKNIARKVAA